VVSGTVPVDVWGYKDAMLQSEQPQTLDGDTYYKAVLNVADRQLIRLEYDHEVAESPLFTDRVINYALLFKDGGGSDEEWNWNNKSRKSIYLIDLNNGNKRLIEGDLPGTSHVENF
jgi:hypothetical protein